MVKILHVGNGNEKHRGRRFYDVGRKLQHGLIRNNHNALFFSDRDIARTHGIAGTRLGGKVRANARLLEVVRNFKPEMILLGHADIITNNTLAAIREVLPSVRIAQFNVDVVFRPENDAAIKNKLPYVDASFITTGGSILNDYTAHHTLAAYIPNPIDPACEMYRCHEHEEMPYDVFYAIRATTTSGTLEHTNRLMLPRYIAEEVQGLRPHFFGFDGKPELFSGAFYDAIGQCAMGLNLSSKQTTKGERIDANEQQIYLYSSDRISQYLGCGLLVFTETGFAQEQLFSEDEMVFFASPEELADKVRYYKDNVRERMRIARGGWLKAHRHLNATLVSQFIVDVTMTGQPRDDYRWDTTCYGA